MGGNYYEREVYIAPVSASPNPNQQPSSSKSYSDQASKALSQKSLHKSNDPKRFALENRKLLCSHKHPIVFALDVSASMEEWPNVKSPFDFIF